MAQSKEEAGRKAFFRSILAKYGVTEQEYRALYRAQGGRCYVCRKATGKSRRLGVDHNHITGEVRGLVCTGSLSAMTCNRLIAIFTRAALVRAVEMLSDPPPARAVLVAMRTGATEIPSVVGNPSFAREVIEGADSD
jgi:hypothetical protein